MNKLGSVGQFKILLGVIGALLVVGGLFYNLRYFDSGYSGGAADAMLPVAGLIVLAVIPLVRERGGLTWRTSLKDLPLLIAIVVLIFGGVLAWSLIG